MSFSVSSMDDLLNYLLSSGVDRKELTDDVVPQLKAKGFKKVGDLEDLEESDLNGINELTKRRIWRLIHSANTPSSFSFNVEITQAQEDKESDIYVRYVLCDKTLFSGDIMQTSMKDIDPATMTLLDITNCILEDAKIPPEQAIELYSSEGYPLHNNEITNKAPLLSWGISDGDLFYVMIRSREQPGMKKFATLPELDHNIGQETFNIETPFHGSFQVNAYMDCDSPEDIAQKVYSLTDIPVPYMSLFIRRGYNYERMSAFTEMEDKDIIRVILRNPQEVTHPRSPHYGIHTYNPLVPQSEVGMSKFYSILKFLCSTQPYNKEYDFDKLLSYLMSFTNFPPLVHALQFLKDHSFLSIAGWTALIEGFYYLCKRVINNFATVHDKEIFEYSDYVLSILICNSHDVEEVSDVESELHSLVCPLSGIKIRNPVYISSHNSLGPFDKENILAKMTNGENFSEFGLHVFVKEYEIIPDLLTSRLLMYYPWETDIKVSIWNNPPKEVIPMICKKVEINFTWLDMLSSLPELCVVNPRGLYAGSECLTYNSKGQLVYFMGSAKGTDEHRRIYNPLSTKEDYLQLVSKDELQKIGSQVVAGNISHDIVSVLKDVSSFTEHINTSSAIRTSAIIQPQDSIRWETEEAIVVLFDHSGSMSGKVFPEMPKLRRIDAAKQLFNAFVTRTQAYKLHHSFGLTLFDDRTTIKLNIVNNMEEFEMSLNDVEPRGGTSLTKAVINAIDQLRKYPCRKRILCLTDGYSDHNPPYPITLEKARAHGVIIDTVLLTWPSDNSLQKALCHASGGVCVLPRTMQEALRYFEMDSMLSVKERVTFWQIHLTASISYFENVTRFPYETEDSFKSSYIQTFQQVKTCSTQKYVDFKRGNLCTSSQQKRIMKELMEFMHNPHDHISIFPSQNEYNKWKVIMCAPEHTAYKRGTFVLSVHFLEKYPFVPPEVRFLTSIYYCNISSSSGRICHSILSESYTPSTSMRDILCYIYGLLMCPDMDSPLDSALADEYGYLSHREKDLNKALNSDRYFRATKTYFDKAEFHVMLHASKRKEDLEKELSG